MAKLTELDILEIRRLRASGLYQHQIASRFGVSQPLIGMVLRREIWAHVEESS